MIETIFVVVLYSDDDPGIEEVCCWSESRQEAEAAAIELRAEKIEEVRKRYERYSEHATDPDTARWYLDIARRPDEKWPISHEVIEVPRTQSATRTAGEVRR